MKVLVADKFEPSGLDGLRAIGCEVVYEPDVSGDDLLAAIERTQADVLVVRSTKVTRPMLEKGKLSLVVRAGAGTNTIDVEAASERVLSDLRTAGIVGEHRLLASHSVVLDPAYVHITKRSLAEVASAKDVLARHGVHSIGRYGSWTYCSIEDNVIEARTLAERLAPASTADRT